MFFFVCFDGLRFYSTDFIVFLNKQCFLLPIESFIDISQNCCQKFELPELHPERTHYRHLCYQKIELESILDFYS